LIESGVDVQEGVRLFGDLALKNCSNAQYALGRLYFLGEVVPQDFGLALKWLNLAVVQGCCSSYVLLGQMWRDGKGVGIDCEKAFEMFSLAAEKKDVFGQLYLGNMYYFGEGQKKIMGML